jgi:hypothetical protein
VRREPLAVPNQLSANMQAHCARVPHPMQPELGAGRVLSRLRCAQGHSSATTASMLRHGGNVQPV